MCDTSHDLTQLKVYLVRKLNESKPLKASSQTWIAFDISTMKLLPSSGGVKILTE